MGTDNSSLTWFINLKLWVQKIFRWLEQLSSFDIKFKNTQWTINKVNNIPLPRYCKLHCYNAPPRRRLTNYLKQSSVHTIGSSVSPIQMWSLNHVLFELWVSIISLTMPLLWSFKKLHHPTFLPGPTLASICNVGSNWTNIVP